MESTRKESNKKSEDIWYLSQQLGIATWKDMLSLPDSDLRHSSKLIELERSLGFASVLPPDEGSSLPAQIFISETTDLLSLSKYLPFLFDRYQVYLCSDSLIKQRLLALTRDPLLDHDSQATKILAYILEKAAAEQASDIHIESLSGEKQIRLRVDGKLKQLEIPEGINDRLFIKIKLHAGMDIAQKRAPQDGHFPYVSSKADHFDLRVSTVPGIFGEKIVLRLLPTSSVQFSMKEMGFSDKHISILRKAINVKTGMILFTGPTGSGKTTSLYSILKELQSESLNILTIEDPVEYRLDGITQVEVNNLAGIGFASALRSFLRQDPDVILVGEIRDMETATIAARAAQTGHLVLSTLHSNDVFEAVHRLDNLGVKGDDIATSLKLVVSQRLVPRLCSCGAIPDCPVCFGKGISGRLPILEMLPITPEIKRLLSYSASLTEIEQKALESGFVCMRECGMDLVENNKISSLDLEAVCPANSSSRLSS